ncbi:MAG: hypothetical protein A2283_21555 [Lentisphaerae bacterium RIFOXYA12_FULL_48_11]|nr:MAG: hypothetical protein A2283_21555 [Lentisphaerae bacterium RIFOXYA12_FULL_48_11]
MTNKSIIPVCAVLIWSFSNSMLLAERVSISLDGTWRVAESVAGETIPANFDHEGPVPGLVNQAKPVFKDVDHYETHEYVWTMAKNGVLPADDKCEGLGRTRQTRRYFWFRKTFTVPARKEVAILLINKAQFGAAVWLNGKKIGENFSCFTSSRFNVTDAMQWSGTNELVIRIGAHPEALPEWVPYGTDGEKATWTPGIYDSVSLQLMDNPVIESVQVAPHIASSEILVQTQLRNYGKPRRVELTHAVRTWQGDKKASRKVSSKVNLGTDEEKTVTNVVAITDAVLWNPENPFLYVARTGTGGDSCETRFGMREFRFDTSTRRAMLNGKVCFMRGASITLHRFLGDPQCGGLPWDEAWVRKFLVYIPRRMHWNSFRICIGPVPQKWLDIADEAGLLLQYEFPIWSDREPLRHKLWKEDEVVRQVEEFVRDNWNHPSVAIWDASNETHWDFLGEKLVPAVRKLDLSGRPWENGYSLPQAPDDPFEDHPYLFINHWGSGKDTPFQMTELERMRGRRPGTFYPASAHASIINEYDWLWLHRDGTPTVLTRKVFANCVGSNATAEARFEFAAYCLGGLTEFWRAYRQYAGVQYLAYLDADLPNVFTCDNLHDVKNLEFEPRFEYYMREAFKPLGVYINFWQPHARQNEERSYQVMMINDEHDLAKGRLLLTWENAGDDKVVSRQEMNYEIPGLGQMSYQVKVQSPKEPGNYILKAAAYWDGKPWSPVVSRRKVQVR